MKKGFTLVEMLVVIGIIAVLMSASMVGYSKFIKTAEDAKTSELISNVTTALSALYQQEGLWPKRLVVGSKKPEPFLDADAALPLAKKGYMTLDYNDQGLKGYDRFGVLTPDGMTIMKKRGKSVTATEMEGYTVRYAIDLDGDGITIVNDSSCGFSGVKVRATACAWCSAKSKGKKGAQILKSWTSGQEVHK